MPMRVFRLRDRGRKVTRPEMLERGAEGLLIFEHTQAGSGMVSHSSALLMKPASYMPIKVCDPLFDPVMVQLDADGLILRGYENEVVDGVLYQHIQVWLCIPILAPGD